MMRKLLTTVMLTLLGFTVQAQTDGLLLKYNFNNVSGAGVLDESGYGNVTASLKNAASVETMGSFKVLNLGSSNGYLDLTSAAGDLMKAQDNYSFSMYYLVDESTDITGAGNFLWAFSSSEACQQTTGKYTAYRLNAQRIATSTGGWGSETGGELGRVADKGVWKHLVYVVENNTGKIYLDGTLVITVADMPANTTNFSGETISCCWIGRPPFSGDNYLKNTLVYGISLYNRALTEAEITKMAKTTRQLTEQYERGSVGDNTALLAAISEAEAFASAATGQYPAGAISDYQDMIRYARYVATDGFSQAVMDRMVSELADAKSQLQAVQGVIFDTSAVVSAYDADRGFLHPGGLHTAEDFVRVKAQLAAGNEKVTAAYNILKNATYAQPTTATWPVETIVRGGSSGQNYINAARGATIAYQNALRWQIEGNRDCAQHAVDVLMAWARTCKLVSGDSNWALAAGLYGYQFAQAAELVRDFDGWPAADFETFKQWMLTVWYPGNVNFMRARNGTWENAGRWWRAPGHYWSNWTLCNALAIISIGILCDDVFIYNQGMSFMKYDQVGTFENPRTADPILNDGCTEFIGNLIVTTAPVPDGLERNGYGIMGQMQESGRDGGHAAMALGLAVDIAKTAWNQGDDLFSYMDNRLAAGVEFLAGQTQSVEGMPWTTYAYREAGIAVTDSRAWTMTGYALGAEVRPYWGTVIGHYEGVKGVKMPYSEMAYEQMGIDGGGSGGTSNGYDHLGYSVLMNTYDGMAAASEVPTLLTPKMLYNGETIEHNELGGLTNTYVPNLNTCVAPGGTVTLMPQLPAGESNTGLWQWNTGETTQNITVSTNTSHVYRATYTNANGVKSYQVFTIAVDGDCQPSPMGHTIYQDGIYLGETDAQVDYGSSVTLNAWNTCGYGGEVQWSNGQTGTSITLSRITSDRTITAICENQGGTYSEVVFTISCRSVEASTRVKDPSAGADGYNITDAYPEYLNTDALANWTNSGFQVQTGGTYVKDDAQVTDSFLEAFTFSPGTLDDKSMEQTITGLPNGTYYIGGSFIATQQSTPSYDVEGVIFHAGDQQVEVATVNAVPEIYSLAVTVTDHTLTYGLRTESTTANWVAMDNLFLLYSGTEAEYLSSATGTLPVRVVVDNSRMNGDFSGWTLAGNTSGTTDVWQPQTASYTNFSTQFIESWINANDGTLTDKSVSQSHNLPAGHYKLRASVESVNQKTLAVVSGVELFLGSASTSCSTGNGTPALFTVETDLEAGTNGFGLRLTDATANWVGLDNVILFYYGDGEVAPSQNPASQVETYDITNAVAPWLSTSDLAHWTNTGMAVNTGAGSAPYSNDDGALVNYPFLERWVGSGSALANTSIQQTITDLPNGTYFVGGSFIAVRQNNATAETTGVTFWAVNDSQTISTGDAVPEVYSIQVEVTDHTLTFGLSTESTSANWIAMDNLFLKYKGTKEEYLALASDDYPVPLNVTNPRMEAVDGWTASPSAPTLNVNLAEYYEKTFNFTQTLTDMPAGRYELRVQAFQRPGGTDAVYADYVAGTDNVEAELLLGSDSKKILNLMADRSATSLYTPGNWMNDAQMADGTYVPHRMEGVAAHFAAGSHENSLETETSGGDLTFGIRSAATGTAYWTIFDNFRLYYYGEVEEDAYHMALRLAKASSSTETDGYGAATAAVAQYEWTDEQYAAKTEEQIATAIAVLNNGTAISKSSQSASSLIANPSFLNADETDALTYGTPPGWSANQNLGAHSDVWYSGGVFNGWGSDIKNMELFQTINNLPNGTYRLTADCGTDIADGSSTVAIYAAPTGSHVARSEEVITLNTNAGRAFDTYDCYFEVVNNSVTIGIRGVNHYFQVKNFTLTCVPDNEAETDASYLRQDYFWNGRNAYEYDATAEAYVNAKNVKVYPAADKKNQLIRAAAADQFENTVNKIVDGNCASLVLTDGYGFQNSQAFTALNATYSRSFSNDWGTLVLPYAVKSTSDMKFYELVDVKGAGKAEGVMTFNYEETLPAGTPSVIHLNGPAEMDFSAASVVVEPTGEASDSPVPGWTFTGSYERLTLDATQTGAPAYYYIAQNKFWHSVGTLTVEPFRAYFSCNTDAEVADRFNIALTETATDIRRVDEVSSHFFIVVDKGQVTLHTDRDTDFNVFSAGGVKVASGRIASKESKTLFLHPGIYLINGKKVMVR